MHAARAHMVIKNKPTKLLQKYVEGRRWFLKAAWIKTAGKLLIRIPHVDPKRTLAMSNLTLIINGYNKPSMSKWYAILQKQQKEKRKN